ncbi:hypothetical protein HYY72_01510 [Candidatus Woesearchaeota archaeon]|nr:hypothetical protein [Candidatus Woesearchaeota archaeon]
MTSHIFQCYHTKKDKSFLLHYFILIYSLAGVLLAITLVHQNRQAKGEKSKSD